MNIQSQSPTPFVNLGFGGKGIHHLSNENRPFERGDRVLVKKDDNDKWTPVPKLDGNIDSVTLENDYAVWKDKEVVSYEGVDLRWTNGTPNIVRPRDGQIQNTEVRGLYGYKEGLRVDTEEVVNAPAWRSMDGIIR